MGMTIFPVERLQALSRFDLTAVTSKSATAAEKQSSNQRTPCSGLLYSCIVRVSVVQHTPEVHYSTTQHIRVGDSLGKHCK